MTAGERAMRLQAKRAAAGLCVRCGNAHERISRRTKARAAYCDACSVKRKAWNRDRNHDGLCASCGTPHTRLNKHGQLALACGLCAADQRDAQRLRYRRKCDQRRVAA